MKLATRPYISGTTTRNFLSSLIAREVSLARNGEPIIEIICRFAYFLALE